MMDLNNIQRDDIRGLEDFMARHKKHLHPNHASLMEVLSDVMTHGTYYTYIFLR